MADLTETEVSALLEDVRVKRDRFTEAIKAIGTDESIHADDQFMHVCRLLDIPLVPSVIHNDGMGTSWCGVCGVEVLREETHATWHLRIQAATKLAYWVAELSSKHTGLLGYTLATSLSVLADLTGES